jgi:hypothetical protein
MLTPIGIYSHLLFTLWFLSIKRWFLLKKDRALAFNNTRRPSSFRVKTSSQLPTTLFNILAKISAVSFLLPNSSGTAFLLIVKRHILFLFFQTLCILKIVKVEIKTARCDCNHIGRIESGNIRI